MGKLLTDRELAEYLKLSKRIIFKYVNAGKIPAHRVGSRLRFDKDQIDELLKNKKLKSNN